jgi:hypothetical protein
MERRHLMERLVWFKARASQHPCICWPAWGPSLGVLRPLQAAAWLGSTCTRPRPSLPCARWALGWGIWYQEAIGAACWQAASCREALLPAATGTPRCLAMAMLCLSSGRLPAPLKHQHMWGLPWPLLRRSGLGGGGEGGFLLSAREARPQAPLGPCSLVVPLESQGKEAKLHYANSANQHSLLQGVFPGSDVSRMVELQPAAFLGGEWPAVKRQVGAAAEILQEGLRGADTDFMFQASCGAWGIVFARGTVMHVDWSPCAPEWGGRPPPPPPGHRRGPTEPTKHHQTHKTKPQLK